MKLKFLKYKNHKKKNNAYQWNLSDIYLTSYPKSGNTYLSLLIANILKQIKGLNYRIDYFTLHEIIPDIQVNPERIKELDPPRIIKTHEEFRTWDKRISVNGKGFRYPRVVYIVRDGRDVIVSYYHHVKNIYGYKGKFKDFLNDKNIKLGEWGPHVREWVIENNTLDKRNILIVKYEDLRSNTNFTLNNVLNFIGIEISEEIVNKAIELSNLKRMQSIEKRYGAPEKYANPSFTFARKGMRGGVEVELRNALIEYYEANVEIFEFLGYCRT